MENALWYGFFLCHDKDVVIFAYHTEVNEQSASHVS